MDEGVPESVREDEAPPAVLVVVVVCEVLAAAAAALPFGSWCSCVIIIALSASS